MESLQEYISEYRSQLEKGFIQKAYQGLMEYIMGLRTYLQTKYPDYAVSSNIYYGYMDMTYFAFTPKSLKDRKLKIAIVFVYDSFQFEIWLAGNNKQVQKEYWSLFKESGWVKYKVVPTTKGVDSIVESVLVGEPDFSDLAALTEQIEQKVLTFIRESESFLARY